MNYLGPLLYSLGISCYLTSLVYWTSVVSQAWKALGIIWLITPQKNFSWSNAFHPTYVCTDNSLVTVSKGFLCRYVEIFLRVTPSLLIFLPINSSWLTVNFILFYSILQFQNASLGPIFSFYSLDSTSRKEKPNVS